MQRRMMLQDDIKEYWGFYLLKDSTVKLSVCSRYVGASFIVVKVSQKSASFLTQHWTLKTGCNFFQSLKDARRCAFLGELDSVEDSDEISDEFEFSDEWSDEAYEFDRADYSTAVAAARAREAEEEVTDGSSSGETAFRHHKASLNAMSKVQSRETIATHVSICKAFVPLQ